MKKKQSKLAFEVAQSLQRWFSPDSTNTHTHRDRRTILSALCSTYIFYIIHNICSSLKAVGEFRLALTYITVRTLKLYTICGILQIPSQSNKFPPRWVCDRQALLAVQETLWPLTGSLRWTHQVTEVLLRLGDIQLQLTLDKELQPYIVLGKIQSVSLWSEKTSLNGCNHFRISICVFIHYK